MMFYRGGWGITCLVRSILLGRVNVTITWHVRRMCNVFLETNSFFVLFSIDTFNFNHIKTRDVISFFMGEIMHTRPRQKQGGQHKWDKTQQYVVTWETIKITMFMQMSETAARATKCKACFLWHKVGPIHNNILSMERQSNMFYFVDCFSM